jgi:dTDP-4-dehydrorhamnose reductase
MKRNMTRPVILLLGANGQVGHELQRTLPDLGSVVALGVPEIDFSQPESLREIVRAQRPDIIVNAAAYTAVDKAESESERAFAINAAAPGVLAEEAEALGVCLVHYSTDYVFDGRKSSPYVETDATGPLSVYGRSKLDGECRVQGCAKHLTFRTGWVVGVHGQNFIKTMLRLASDKEALRVVADQFGSPTSAALLAEVTAKTLARMIDRPASDARWGLYHLVAAGHTSWHGLARYVVARAVAMGLPLKVKPEAVLAITTSEYPTSATRPQNSRLDTRKFQSTFALTPADWTQGVNDVLDRLIPQMLK